MQKNMENLAYFTEAMQTAHRMAKTEKEKAVNVLSRFLKEMSMSDLEKITQDSKRGAELMAMKTNPSLVDGFVESIDTAMSFRDWIASYSRSWLLLNQPTDSFQRRGPVLGQVLFLLQIQTSQKSICSKLFDYYIYITFLLFLLRYQNIIGIIWL